MGMDISITKHVFFMWVVSGILILILSIVANSYKKSLIPKGLTNFLEIIIVFVRDEIVKPTIGHGYEKFLPYLLTVFFFILFSNFIGLIPFTATVTSNIAVTATLAAFTFIATQLGGVMHHGFFGYFKGLIPPGMPAALLPLIVVVEILGLFTKPFALCIRLFANMTAGHVVILSLIGLIFIMQTIYVAPVSVGFALFIYLLEILVALIQAYIFTMLSSLFIGMAVHQEH
jgi:F-type H+-transporting ATPase subunit a